MIAIIPAAGLGKRLRPVTYKTPKVLLRIGEKRIIDILVEKLIKIGIRKFVFVIRPTTHGKKIKDYIKKNYSIESKFVVQKKCKGAAHAILLTKKYINEPILIVFCDTLFTGSIGNIFKKNFDGVIGVKEVKDPRRFGVVVVKRGRILKLIEKPEKPISNLAIIGVYFIKNYRELFKCIEEIIKKKIKTKGEYQLTDALELMVERGAKLGVFKVKKWLDCGKVEAVLETNREIMKHKPRGTQNCRIKKPVFSYRFKNRSICCHRKKLQDCKFNTRKLYR